MPRVWSIQEQVYVEPVTKLRFEFTSEHTEAMARGEGPTLHDEALLFNVYNEANTKVIRMRVRRHAWISRSEVEGIETPAPATPEEKERLDLLTEQPVKTAVAAPGTETTQAQAWAGVNIAPQFSGDIE